jgi:hypothetical protein
MEKVDIMEKKTEAEKLPLRSLHDFLVEIESEWNRFRTGSLFSIIILVFMILLFIRGYLFRTLRNSLPFERLFAFLFLGLLFYTTYVSWRQYKFYEKWEKRIGLILHLEQELLGE